MTITRRVVLLGVVLEVREVEELFEGLFRGKLEVNCVGILFEVLGADEGLLAGHFIDDVLGYGRIMRGRGDLLTFLSIIS